jgi:hypothetical protein
MKNIIDDSQIPTTEHDLEAWMKENCFNFNSYSINGNSIYEGFGIDRTSGVFIWYYTERGHKDNIKYFQTEKEIIECAYNQIKSDIWAKAHCIGFTTDKIEARELTEKLKSLSIEFMQDDIPYHGPQRPVYRVFVFGCDYKKVIDLKDKYYKEQ